ncbi:EF-hand calcium-binding domain-containing protein 1 [Aplysia californica]|uniref:EF-hand calcium-binding domain-containing protein 1 n=1 Tax=Aplysia californica TaxID=6500 RepID=A0ABM0JB67_APLCA|nr:EF-hand calcium-binding domain-containing protein 1 [Aplysia californica]
MASKHSSRQSKEQFLNQMVKTTRLPKEEVNHLMSRFDRLCRKEEGKLHRDEFRDELNRSFNITDDILMDRVFRAFDKRSCGTLRQEDYVSGIAKFLNGTVDEQVQMVFDVYDLNNDGYISREEMFQLLKSSLVKAPTEEDPDELVKELVEIVMKKLDNDHDGRVSLPDFRAAVAEEKLLLEALGKCLPDEKCKMTFQEMIRMFGSGTYCPSSSVNISQQKEQRRQTRSGQKAA